MPQPRFEFNSCTSVILDPIKWIRTIIFYQLSHRAYLVSNVVTKPSSKTKHKKMKVSTARSADKAIPHLALSWLVHTVQKHYMKVIFEN